MHLPNSEFWLGGMHATPMLFPGYPRRTFASTGIKRQGSIVPQQAAILSEKLPRRQTLLGCLPNSGRAKKRCAAQAEYFRLAAQAYSPSDAMSQAILCLAAAQKVQSGRVNSPTETGACGWRICW
jgi:hypothetical protein